MRGWRSKIWFLKEGISQPSRQVGGGVMAEALCARRVVRVRSGHGPEGAWPRCWPDHMGGLPWMQKMGSSHHSASSPSAVVQIDLWFLFCKMNFNILLLFPLERQQSCCIVYKKAETGWTSRSSWSRELVSISAKNEVNLLYTCHQHWDLTI